MRSPGGIAARPLVRDPARSRFLINVGSNVCYVGLNVALMVWYVPFLVHRLGVAAYGMISLANSLVLYAGIISVSLDTSINRFLAIDLNQGNEAGANRTFNTALALSLAVCVFLALPAGFVTCFFPVLFKVPAGLELATQFLFAGVGATMLAAILGGSFGVASLITHRFDLRNIVRALTSLSRVGVVALCFLFWPVSLWHVAAGFMVSACVGLIGDVLIWRSLTPQLRIDRRDIDRRQFRALMGLGGWVTVSQIGYLLLTQVNLLVVNAVFGAEMTGRYGSVLLLPTLIYTMLEIFVTVLSPAIMARYAVGDIEGMRRIASRSVKILGIGLALPIGLLCGFGRPLLTLWLGPEFASLDLLLVLLVGHLTVNLAVRPLAYVLTAFNRVKAQGLATLAFGAANLALVIAVARWGGWGVAGVAAASALMYTIRNAVSLSSYTGVVMRLRWWAFYTPLLAGALGTLGVALASRFVSQLWWPTSWLALGVLATAIAAAYCLFACTISLDRADRDLLWSFLKRRRYDYRV
jgi:membrane protein EpsK